MSYNSLTFVLTLPAILAAYYALPHRWRNALLLLVGIALYMLWWPAGVLVIGWVTVISRVGTQKLQGHSTRNLLWLTILATALPLLFFKYLQPLNTYITGLLDISWTLNRHRWAIPVGLSFYTLQAIALEIDVYQEKCRRAESWLTHALFICYFPIASAGPIVRREELLSQIESRERPFNPDLAWRGVRWIIWGMFMKLAVSESFALFVEAVDARIDTQSGFTLLVGAVCYTIQLYADFAGYSLMALGTSALLGIRLCDNFRHPLFAVGVRDFWRRWHISLSTWLRDYIYIPLGGSRCSRLRTNMNLLVTFLVSGLWHGAGWAFVLWGGMHGLWVIVERAVRFDRWPRSLAIRGPVWLLTLVTASLLFITFTHDAGTTLHIVRRIATDLAPFRLTVTSSVNTLARELTMVSMLVLMLAKEWRDEFRPGWLRGRGFSVAFYAMVILITLTLGVFDRSGQFIYMHF